MPAICTCEPDTRVLGNLDLSLPDFGFVDKHFLASPARFWFHAGALGVGVQALACPANTLKRELQQAGRCPALQTELFTNYGLVTDCFTKAGSS